MQHAARAQPHRKVPYKESYTFIYRSVGGDPQITGEAEDGDND